MRLTAEAFQQVIQTLRSDAARQDGAKELRKQPRVGVRGRATILIHGKAGSRPVQVNVRDLSSNGIGLLHGEPLMAAGDQFLLVLPTENETARLSILYVVKRLAKLSPNLYMIGAGLVQEVGVSEVKPPPAAAAARAVPATPPAAAHAPTLTLAAVAMAAPTPATIAKSGSALAATAQPARGAADEEQERIRRAILG